MRRFEVGNLRDHRLELGLIDLRREKLGFVGDEGCDSSFRRRESGVL